MRGIYCCNANGSLVEVASMYLMRTTVCKVFDQRLK